MKRAPHALKGREVSPDGNARQANRWSLGARIGGLLLMPVLFATGAPFLASWNNAAVLAAVIVGERLPLLSS